MSVASVAVTASLKVLVIAPATSSIATATAEAALSSTSAEFVAEMASLKARATATETSWTSVASVAATASLPETATAMATSSMSAVTVGDQACWAAWTLRLALTTPTPLVPIWTSVCTTTVRALAEVQCTPAIAAQTSPLCTAANWRCSQSVWKVSLVSKAEAWWFSLQTTPLFSLLTERLLLWDFGTLTLANVPPTTKA